jgi:hypothetical protein
MTRSDDQRIADILDACDELSSVVALREAGNTSAQVLLRAAERLRAVEQAPLLAAALRGQTAPAWGVSWPFPGPFRCGGLVPSSLR